jgi:dihydropteroate synthase
MQIVTKRKVFNLTNKTLVMGILNVTPDSFSDGGKFSNIASAVVHAKEMVAAGADILDIGGESTRPGAEQVSLEEELQRVIPVIEAIRKELGDQIILSIDTYKAQVAQKAIEAGADMINDVSGLQLDKDMPKVAALLQVPIIINHMRGIPKTMQEGKIVYTDVIEEITQFFAKQISLLKKVGVTEKNIILDPGFGFGKTVEQNVEILKRFGELKKFHLPLLIGVSRKSTIGKLLHEELGKEFLPTERLEGSLAATAIAVMHGADMVRTHDVQETKRFLAVLDTLL